MKKPQPSSAVGLAMIMDAMRRGGDAKALTVLDQLRQDWESQATPPPKPAPLPPPPEPPRAPRRALPFAEDPALIGVDEIAELSGISRSYAADRIVKQPSFPKPEIKLSSKIRWWNRAKFMEWASVRHPRDRTAAGTGRRTS
jgi:predicted DNA-binding transcriptional regulator AlpA